jgi:glycosyltransferase involved in cell wall biosynthesis
VINFSVSAFQFSDFLDMRWLIVEDALRDRKGHWFEYLGTFVRELRALGDDVTVLVDRAAEPFLVEQLQAQPVLPASIWHRMNDGSGPLRRYLRVPVHAWRTYRAIKKYVRRNEKFDVIFVPTVLVHHLLGWVLLVKRALKQTSTRVILFFPNTPIQLDLKTNEPSWLPAPTAKLFCRLIRSLRDEVKHGRVILGAETEPMREALMRMTGVPFTYFPHPVTPGGGQGAGSKERHISSTITMASYGSARYEKGSDLLVAAVDEFCRRYPDSRVRFVLQSVDGDANFWEHLKGNPKIRLIPDYFADGEYAQRLQETDVLLLPYRRSSYALRVSRVVIEAMVHGIPVVATRGTTLAEQAEEFGAAVLCEDENAESLVAAMHDLEQRFDELKQRVELQKQKAREHFSIVFFRELLMKTQS